MKLSSRPLLLAAIGAVLIAMNAAGRHLAHRFDPHQQRGRHDRSTAVTLNLSATDYGGSGIASMRFRNSHHGPLQRVGALPDHQGLDADQRSGNQEGLRPVHGRGGEYLGRQSGRGGRPGLLGLDRAQGYSPAHRLDPHQQRGRLHGHHGGDPEPFGHRQRRQRGRVDALPEQHRGPLQRLGALPDHQGLGR